MKKLLAILLVFGTLAGCASTSRSGGIDGAFKNTIEKYVGSEKTFGKRAVDVYYLPAYFRTF